MSDRKLGAPRRSIVKATHALVFKRVHGTQLIYICAWEDPRLDRELMKLGPDSSVVMITSAGCNALDYLLARPAAVPAIDMNIRQTTYPGGLTSFVKDKLKRVLTEVPIEDNYFWRVYLTGGYTPDCAPGYLNPDNLPLLAANADHVHTHTMTVSHFLKDNPGNYSHYVLQDHQDRLTAHDPVALREEWELILANSRPGTKVLMRSAGFDISFVPEDVRARLRFCPEVTGPMHLKDRVGTYGSLHFGEVL